MKRSQQPQKEPEPFWQKTQYANLVRYKPSSIYFARLRVQGKLIRKSLKTDSISVAKLRLADLEEGARKRAEQQTTIAKGKVAFGEALEIFQKRIAAQPNLKSKTKSYYDQRVIALLKSWPGLEKTDVRKITKTDCLNWAAEFSGQTSPIAFNHTVSVLRRVIDVSLEMGVRYDNPAKAVGWVKETPKKLRLPEPHQFDQFVKEIETSGSGFAKRCADLVRFLAYGGFRIGEAINVCWKDVDFQKNLIVVRGPEDSGLKGRVAGEERLVPMIAEMRSLVERLRKERPSEGPDVPVMQVRECQKAMNRAANLVGLTKLTHHDLRHLFATRCIEAGVDIPTVSRWLGHKDGGALAMRVYGHLRDQHSTTMAKKVTFSAGDEKIIPMPKAAEPSVNQSHAPTDDRRAAAKAKAKYSYPWWASENQTEVFWGQVNETVQIVSTDKFLTAAKEAMGREVFRQELADPQALIEEFEARVSKELLDRLVAKIQKNSNLSEKASA